MQQDKVVTFPLSGLERRSAAPQPEASRFADGRAFGEFLRQHRQARHVPIHEIANRTKILASRLEALERGDVRFWPAGIYGRAMVRNYALAVGLDPDDVVKEFTKLFPAPDPHPALEPAPPARRVFPPARLVRLLAQAARVRPSSIPRLPVPRIALNRRAVETFGSIVLGAVLGASVAWTAMDFAPGRGVTATQPPGATAHAATGSIHAAQLVVDSSGVTTGAAVSSRFDDPLSVSPSAPITPAAAHVGLESIEGRLRVTSNVPGARVTVNGIGWGSTPLIIRHLPPGPKRIRATKDGYGTVERTVELTPDRSDLAVQLELRPL